jgi:hypothetical protein
MLKREGGGTFDPNGSTRSHVLSVPIIPVRLKYGAVLMFSDFFLYFKHVGSSALLIKYIYMCMCPCLKITKT